MYLELCFEPNIELISVVRRFVTSVQERLRVGRALAARVALAMHELLENSVKYSTDGKTRLRIEVFDDGGLAQVSIRTWNRTEGHHRRSLQEGLDDLRGAADPLACYQTMMVNSARRSDGSGLGLARIRAEVEIPRPAR